MHQRTETRLCIFSASLVVAISSDSVSHKKLQVQLDIFSCTPDKNIYDFTLGKSFLTHAILPMTSSNLIM